MRERSDARPSGAQVPYTLRPYHQGDEPALLALLDAAFDGWPSYDIPIDPLEHLRWKLRSDARALRSHVVAESEGRVAGLRVILTLPVWLDGEVFAAAHAVDNAVDPALRGRGVMTALREYADAAAPAEYDFQLGGLTTHPAMQRLDAARGRKPIANDLRSWQRRHAPLDVAPAPLRVRMADRFDERAERLCAEAAPAFRFMVLRSVDWLSWRYADPRAGGYQIFLAEDGDRLAGYATARVSKGKGQIADVLALPGRPDVVRALVAAAATGLQEAGARLVECYLPNVHPYTAALEELGFARRRSRRWMNYSPLRLPGEALALLDGPRAPIHLTLGDTDLI